MNVNKNTAVFIFGARLNLLVDPHKMVLWGSHPYFLPFQMTLYNEVRQRLQLKKNSCKHGFGAH